MTVGCGVYWMSSNWCAGQKSLFTVLQSMPTYYHLNTQPWQLPQAKYSYRNQPAGATVLLSSCEPPQLTAAAICAWQYDRFVGSWAAANSGMRDAARRFGMNKVILVTIWDRHQCGVIYIERLQSRTLFYSAERAPRSVSVQASTSSITHTNRTLCMGSLSQFASRYAISLFLICDFVIPLKEYNF